MTDNEAIKQFLDLFDYSKPVVERGLRDHAETVCERVLELAKLGAAVNRMPELILDAATKRSYVQLIWSKIDGERDWMITRSSGSEFDVDHAETPLEALTKALGE